ncbi:MAG: alanine--glyoxylate aminotransferase family protein [Gemmatimonadaceae bacterium]|nr:alanine--glyoxylate aminotransferase family protein [Gemmatimonadaceae bacterium]
MSYSFGKFFVPGPTDVRPDVLAAMAQPMIAHRGPEFEAMFARIQERLRLVFRTERPVYVSSSSATGLMEAAVRCAPAGRILALVNGGFSERFAKIADMCGRECDRYEVPAGSAHDPAELGRRLAGKKYAAITVVHSETSTGVLNDVRAMSDVAHEHGALCLIDSVSGLGGTPLEFDEWKCDYVLTGSQKALALPPGLAFAAASMEFVRTAKEATGRGVYFDIGEFDDFAAKNQTPNTPAVSLLYAADAQLQAIVAEGIEARWARHAAMQQEVVEWAGRLEHRGIAIVAKPGERSPTVSAIRLPRGTTPRGFITEVRRSGYTLGAGYGALRETTFRIGHMGDHTVATVRGCLAACEETLRSSSVRT